MASWYRELTPCKETANARDIGNHFGQRRRLFTAGLNEIGLARGEPKRAFYTFPSVEHTGLTSEQFAKALLFEEAVAAVPGNAFGESGQGYLRCTYATGMEQLREALVRIERFLKKLATEKL